MDRTYGKVWQFTLLELNDGITNVSQLLDVALQLEHLAEHKLENLLHVDGVRSGAENEGRLHSLGELACLLGDFRLLIHVHGGEEVVLGTNQERGGGLVQQTSLLVPVLDARERGFSREIKHEEQSNGVIAHKRQHMEVLLLTTKIPDREGDISLPERDGLLHEVHTEGLNVVLVEVAFDVFDHQTGLTDLAVTHHANLHDNLLFLLGELMAIWLSCGSC